MCRLVLGGRTPPSTAVFGELCDRLLHRPAALPDRLTQRFLDHASTLASRHRFFHWSLAFPEVFSDEQGNHSPTPGFDAVVGNPPWDMLRGDSGVADVRAGRRLHARRVSDFIREAGVYRIESRSHVNRYQLFVERALQLTRAGGRIGLVLPSGIVSTRVRPAAAPPVRSRRGRLGHGSEQPCRIVRDSSKPAVRPADRHNRTVHQQHRVPVRITRTEDLERDDPPIVVTRHLLERLSGPDDLGIPEIA